MRAFARLISILTALAASAGTLGAAPSVAPHRALYDVSLEDAPGGQVSGVSGKISVEWQHSCAGWTFEYRSLISVTQAETGAVRLSTVATTWESGDGTQYRFNVHNRANGRDLETVEGVASVSADGGGGKVVFSAPKKQEMSLPAGTLFPVAHAEVILTAAASRMPPVFLPRQVFDGMDAEALHLVNAVIGKAGKADGKASPASPNLHPALQRLRRWPVSLAYFKPDAREQVPSHEVNMIVFENGVSDRMIMDFSDFTVRATLSRLEMFPRSDCDSPRAD